MEIQSSRLILKEICWEDLDNIHELNSTPEVDEFNTLGIPANIDETRKLIKPVIESQGNEKRNIFVWSLRTKENNEFIGQAGLILSLDKFKLGEIYYKLVPNAWGKGYGTEVCKALIKIGFDQFNLHKVEAGVATANVKSIKILEKAGMTREGLRRKILPIRGQWVDNYHYAIVEDDPRDY